MKLAVFAALLVSTLPIAARAAPVTYDFQTTGPFGGSAGSFTYDDSIVPPGGGTVTGPGLFTNLTFPGYTGDTQSLEFDSAGNLVRAKFGCFNNNGCVSPFVGICSPYGVCGGSSFWFAWPEVSPSYGMFGVVVVDAVDTAGVTMMRRAMSVPGTFEAEHFDQGGEGFGYHDNTPGNQGDAEYRTGEDVDIFFSNDPAGGGSIIKNFESGEWLAYTINVTTSGNYDVELRAATNFDFPNSSYYVEVDGINVSGIVTLPNTGGWDRYWWTGKSTIALTAGKHLLKIVAVTPYFALNSIRIASPAAPSFPYFSTPTAVPGEFEAEAFDTGGEGVAYHDTSPGNQGDSGFRDGEDMDVSVSTDPGSGSPYVVTVGPGEWLAYTLDASTTGNYDLELRALTYVIGSGPAYHVEIDSTATDTLALGTTLGNYQWIGRQTLALTAGSHTLKLINDGSTNIFLNSVRVTVTGSSTAPPRGIPGVIEAEDFDAGGQGAGYFENTPGNQGNAGFRTNEDVDIFLSDDAGSGSWYIVKNFEGGEWLAYTISVPASGDYDLELRAATNFDFPGSAYHVVVDGANVTGSVVLPDTGGWDHYQWLGKRTISLTAGVHWLAIVVESPYFGFNSLRVLRSSP